MKKLFRSFLAKSRKRRCLALRAALWLLRLLRDVEKDDMWRYSDLLDSFDFEGREVSRREYNAVEDEYISCEYVLGTFESAIEDLEFTY